MAPLAYPILLTPRVKNAYFIDREGFNPVAMLQSPMMLMMIGTGALLFVTPYLMVRVLSSPLPSIILTITFLCSHAWTKTPLKKLEESKVECLRLKVL